MVDKGYLVDGGWMWMVDGRSRIDSGCWMDGVWWMIDGKFMVDGGWRVDGCWMDGGWWL